MTPQWGVLGSMSYLLENWEAFVQAIIRLRAAEPGSIQLDQGPYRMIVMTPRVVPKKRKPSVPSFGWPVSPMRKLGLEEVNEFLVFPDSSAVMEMEGVGTAMGIARPSHLFFILMNTLNPVALTEVKEQSSSRTPSSSGTSPVGLSRLSTSPVSVDWKVSSPDFKTRLDMVVEQSSRRKRSFSKAKGPRGWFVGNDISQCNEGELGTSDRFGKPYIEFLQRHTTPHFSREPEERGEDFAEVYLRVTADKPEHMTYINDRKLCHARKDESTGLYFEFCIAFKGSTDLSLEYLSQGRYLAIEDVSEGRNVILREREVESLLTAYEKVAQPELMNQADTISVDIPGFGSQRIDCIGRGQCKAVITFPALTPGLVFTRYPGYTSEGAHLVIGLQQANIPVYEELAAAPNPHSGSPHSARDIETPAFHQKLSTRCPSVYKRIPGQDGKVTVVEIQHHIPERQLASYYIQQAALRGLDEQVTIPLSDKGYWDDDKGVMVEADKFALVSFREVLKRIMEDLVTQVCQFDENLRGYRALQNMPVSIGMDSKIQNFRVDFHRMRDTIVAYLKNFDNEPPNLSLFDAGVPLYRGGPVFDMISELFQDSSLQDNYIKRVYGLTEFRKLFVKMLASIDAEITSVEASTQRPSRVNLQYFIDEMNRQLSLHGSSLVHPVSVEDVKAYRTASQESHKSFRLYVWACQLASSLLPEKYTMPAAFIPVNHSQKDWLQRIKGVYSVPVTALVIMEEFQLLDQYFKNLLDKANPIRPELSAKLERFHLLGQVSGEQFEQHVALGQTRAARQLIEDVLELPGKDFERLRSHHVEGSELLSTFYDESTGQVFASARERDIYQQRCLQQHLFCRPPEVMTESPRTLERAMPLGRKGLLGLLEGRIGEVMSAQVGHSAQEAMSGILGLPIERIRILIRRLMRDTELAQTGNQQLSQLLQPLDEWLGGMRAEYPQAMMAFFSGLFLNQRLCVLEQVDGYLKGGWLLGVWNQSDGGLGLDAHYVAADLLLNQLSGSDLESCTLLVHEHSTQSRQDEWYEVIRTSGSMEIEDEGIEDVGPASEILQSLASDRLTDEELRAVNTPALTDFTLLYVQLLDALLVGAGLIPFGVPHDNHCLYHAIARYLSRKLGRSITMEEVKHRIRVLLLSLRLKKQLNIPMTEQEKMLVAWFGPMLPQLLNELNTPGLWNDQFMIHLAAHAFNQPIVFLTPTFNPMFLVEHAEPQVNLAQPGAEPQVLAELPPGDVIFFNGLPHWDVAEQAVQAMPQTNLLDLIQLQRPELALGDLVWFMLEIILLYHQQGASSFK